MTFADFDKRDKRDISQCNELLSQQLIMMHTATINFRWLARMVFKEMRYYAMCMDLLMHIVIAPRSAAMAR